MPNLLYAQSGGVTPVINATACGVIERAKQYSQIQQVFAAKNGILGLLEENLIQTYLEDSQAIRGLYHTPGGAFGSCRYKLPSFEKDPSLYERLMQVLSAHNIQYFLYNGGNDSQDTTHKIASISQEKGYPLTCIGIPKTIDNDLMHTDFCPGFGSVAKYVAISAKEASLDVASMAASSTKVFIMEVMGRHTGWIAAATGLAAEKASEGPHIILFPEILFNPSSFLYKVKQCVENYGYCVITVAEGLKDEKGNFINQNDAIKDAFGHTQLGGTAPFIARYIYKNLGYKYHWSVVDYLQRSARHIASSVDVEQAYTLGTYAVDLAIQGKNAIMLTLVRTASAPYQWHIHTIPLSKVANHEKKLPLEFISADGFHITKKCREYLFPLIQGEAYPPYRKGLPDFVQLKNVLIPKKCSI